MNTKILNPRLLEEEAREQTSYNPEDQQEKAKAAEIATLNANALHALRAEYPDIAYAGNRFGYERSEWRATKLCFGKITGLEHMGELTIVATNGVVAWYLRPMPTDTIPFLGHVSHFTGIVAPLFSVRKPGRAKHDPGTKRQTKAELYASL